MKKDAPFPLRLQRMITGAMGRGSGVAGSELEIACLLNRFDADVDDVRYKGNWKQLLVDVIRSPTGREALSSHNWCLLRESTLVKHHGRIRLRNVDMEVLRSLDNAEDWEKLETWMLVVWSSLESGSEMPIEDIKLVTLRLLRQRPSALQRFKPLYGRDYRRDRYIKRDQLREICDQARVEQLSSASL